MDYIIQYPELLSVALLSGTLGYQESLTIEGIERYNIIKKDTIIQCTPPEAQQAKFVIVPIPAPVKVDKTDTRSDDICYRKWYITSVLNLYHQALLPYLRIINYISDDSY